MHGKQVPSLPVLLMTNNYNIQDYVDCIKSFKDIEDTILMKKESISVMKLLVVTDKENIRRYLDKGRKNNTQFFTF